MEGPPSGAGKRYGFKDIPPRVKWLIYLTVFSSIAYGYIIIAITAYMPGEGLITPTESGIIFGVNGIVFVVSALPIGILADRKGRKTIFLLGMAGIPPSILIYAFTTDLLYLVIASAVAGMCEGGFAASWNALIADQTTVKNRNAAFSLSFIVGNAAFGIGLASPFTFPWIEEYTGLSTIDVHNYAFIFMAGLASLSPLLLWLLLRDYREDIKPGAKFVRGENFPILIKFSGINSLIGLGAGFVIPLIPLWLLLKFDVTEVHSGPLIALSTITIGLAAIFSTRIADSMGMVRAITITQGLSTMFMLSLAFAPLAVLAAGLYLVRTALMNMSVPLLDSFLMGIITKEERGFASALNTLIWRLPNSGSLIIGAWLFDLGYLALPFYLATALYATGVTLFYIVFKDVKPHS